MLKPDKYTEPNTCVLNVAFLILTRMQQIRDLPLSECSAMIVQELGNAAASNLMPAISFLYLIELVDYNSATDSIVLLEEVSA